MSIALVHALAFAALAAPQGAVPAAAGSPAQEPGGTVQDDGPKGVPAGADQEPEATQPRGRIAARAVGTIEGTGAPLTGDAALVTDRQLDELFLWREGISPGGQAALRQLLDLRVVEELGLDAGIEVTKDEMVAWRRELDDEAKQAGVEGGLDELMEMQGIAADEFQRYLRAAMLHERLARRALELPADIEISTEQQQLWLQGVLEEREFVAGEHPWTDGMVARSGDVVIGRLEFAKHLRNQLPDEDISEACYMILLERAVRARMPELNDAGVEAALDREVERRRTSVETDPRYRGASYESLLEARGLSIEAVRRDPSIRAAALAHEAIDRAYDEEALTAVYEERRLHFDATYGEAVDVYILYKVAGDDPNNPLLPPIQEVTTFLTEMRDKIETPAEFQRALEIHSEHAPSRDNGGLLGNLSRFGKSEQLDGLRQAAFRTVDEFPNDYRNKVLGPIRLENGVALAMLGERRPAPTWDKMREAVHMELRGEFLEDSLARDQVEMLLPGFGDAGEGR